MYKDIYVLLYVRIEFLIFFEILDMITTKIERYKKNKEKQYIKEK